MNEQKDEREALVERVSLDELETLARGAYKHGQRTSLAMYVRSLRKMQRSLPPSFVLELISAARKGGLT